MELIFLMVIIAATVVAWSLYRRRPPPQALEPDIDRVAVLCESLTGEPARDRPVMNQVLALGPEVLPPLIGALAEALRSEPEDADPDRLARLEDLIAEFGLAAVGDVADALARLRPTTPLAASLLRVLLRMGQPGLATLARQALDQPGLMPFLPRFRRPRANARAPGAALATGLLIRSGRPTRADLQAVAGLVAAHPEVLEELWAAGGSAVRVVVLDWLVEWLPLARPEHLVAGLADPAHAVRCASARLATLMVEPALVPALVEMADDDDLRCRRAAVRALAAWPHPRAVAGLVQAAGDAEPDVAAMAIFGLISGPVDALAAGVSSAHALAQGALGELLAAEAPFDAGAGDPAALADAIEQAEGDERALLIALLGRHLGRHPLARERLIRLADGESDLDRALAVHVLAAQGDPTAADLLARALRRPVKPSVRLRLQEAAQHLGLAAVMPLARRLSADQPERLADQLAVLRVQDYAEAVPSILRALDETRDGRAEAQLGTTLFIGGSGVEEALEEGLRLPSRGLLAPTLRYLGAWASASDLARLMVLFDRHPPLRGILLNLVELQCADAIPALSARIAMGGDDVLMHGLERRLARLEATTRPSWGAELR